jgi:hypothetical protein
MSASDNKMIAAISKMYPSLKKSQIISFVKSKNKTPIIKQTVTKIVVGKAPKVVKKKKKKT